jgi:hypothetical protein
MGLALVALVIGTWIGLVKIGVPLSPRPGASLAAVHGPLMVSAFLGTLISVERAIGLRRRLVYAVPVLTAAGGAVLISGMSETAGQALVTAGSLGAFLVSGYLVRLQRGLSNELMGLGNALWLVGNIAWLAGEPLHVAMPWWVGFLVLTIGGERVQLSRIRHPSSWARAPLVAAVALYVAALSLGMPYPDLGVRLSGAGLVGISAWLLVYDLAPTTIGMQRGPARYSSIGLVLGYLWLGAAGVLVGIVGSYTGGPRYDAFVHAIFLGFGFSMIFVHAPMIFPAITGRPMRFHGWLYSHLFLLHASLLLRVAADLWGGSDMRSWGGAMNAAAIGLFLVNTAWAMLTARGSPSGEKAPGDGVGDGVARRRKPA